MEGRATSENFLAFPLDPDDVILLMRKSLGQFVLEPVQNMSEGKMESVSQKLPPERGTVLSSPIICLGSNRQPAWRPPEGLR